MATRPAPGAFALLNMRDEGRAMTRVIRFIRRLLAFACRQTVRKLALFVSYQTGGLLLRYEGTRRRLNAIYNDLTPKQVLRFCKVFDRAPIWRDFIWSSGFNGRALSVPVMKGVLRTWCNARHWRWFEATSKGTDLFYRFMIEKLTPSVMFDVGANDGMHAYKFALHGFECVCFEPQQTCAEYIRRVCQLNGFDRLRVEECAVSDQEGEVEFYTSSLTWYSSIDRSHTESFEPVTRCRVKAITLDEYCRGRSLAPQVMKIDVEGHEMSVIRGALNVISRYRPQMVIEIWPASESKKDIWTLFKERGYTIVGDDGVMMESLDQFMNAKNPDYLFISDADLARLFLESLRDGRRRPWATRDSAKAD